MYPKIYIPFISKNFYPKKCRIVTTNWIYDNTLYVQLQILAKPWKFYKIPNVVDGDILQDWFVSKYTIQTTLQVS